MFINRKTVRECRDNAGIMKIMKRMKRKVV